MVIANKCRVETQHLHWPTMCKGIGLLLYVMRKTRNMGKIELLYKNVGSNNEDKAWKFWKYITHRYYYAWSHALVLLHVWVGHGTMGLN
jgi:hypothetical protein